MISGISKKISNFFESPPKKLQFNQNREKINLQQYKKLTTSNIDVEWVEFQKTFRNKIYFYKINYFKNCIPSKIENVCITFPLKSKTFSAKNIGL